MQHSIQQQFLDSQEHNNSINIYLNSSLRKYRQVIIMWVVSDI